MRALPAAFGTATDTGPLRKSNEDWAATCELRASPGSLSAPVFVVAIADGMGGHAAGDVASRAAAAMFVRVVSALYERDAAGFDSVAAIERGFAAANGEIIRRGRADATVNGMGTTLTAAILRGNRAFIGHVGDSRVQLFRRGSVRLLTRDHTMAELKVREGILTRDEARLSKDRSRLLRALGMSPRVTPDILVEDMSGGDALVLTTDGVHTAVTERDVASVVSTSTNPQEACARLVALAHRRDGSDNMTAVCLGIGKWPGRASAFRMRATRGRRRSSILTVGVLLLITLLLVVAGVVTDRRLRGEAVDAPASGSSTVAADNVDIPKVMLRLSLHSNRVRVELWQASSASTIVTVAGKAPLLGSLDLPRQYHGAPDQKIEFRMPIARGDDNGWELWRRSRVAPHRLGVFLDGVLSKNPSESSPGQFQGKGLPQQKVEFWLRGRDSVSDIPVRIQFAGNTEASVEADSVEVDRADASVGAQGTSPRSDGGEREGELR